MSELARIANQLRKLDSLINRSSRELQSHPDHPQLAMNIASLENVRKQLHGRFDILAGRSWMDVCKYRFHPSDNLFLPVRQIVETLGGFQYAVGLTMDAILLGKPKDRGRVSPTAADDGALRLGYCEGGETYGDVGFTFVVEKRKDLMDSMAVTVENVFSIASSTDTEQIHSFSERLGPAPIRAVADWCQQHVRADMGSELAWVRDNKVERTIEKTAEQWKQLKETIDLVSDKLEEEIEIEGTLIAANAKTRAFVLEAGREYISGRFVEGVLSKSKAAEVPKDYRFVLRKTVRKNYATDRANVQYSLLRLERLRRPPNPPSEEDNSGD
jgi:hypothetical protein